MYAQYTGTCDRDKKIIIETKVSIVNGSPEKVNILEFKEGFWSMRFK